MARLVLIAAISENGWIGLKNDLPWGRQMSTDMKFFKTITEELGSVLMGRATAQSLGKPLPGRKNFVLSRTGDNVPAGFKTIWDPSHLQNHLASDARCAVIGGAQIYSLLAPYCTTAYISRIHAELEGDVAFPVDAFASFNHVSTLKDQVQGPDDAFPLSVYRLSNSAPQQLPSPLR